MVFHKCVQCGKKLTKRRFCTYLCYARYAISSGAWGPKYGGGRANVATEKWKRYEALVKAEERRA